MSPLEIIFGSIALALLVAIVWRERAHARRDQLALLEIARAVERADAKERAAQAEQAKVNQAIKETSDASPEELERRARDLAARGRMPN